MPAPRTAAHGERPPRRMSRAARYEQLVATAMPLVAQQGLAAVSLDELAARADVTRNLLYHYFPRGRPDVVRAVVERSGRELTEGWVTDEAVPLEQRLAVNFARVLDHALRPTVAWRVHRLAATSAEAELSEIVERFADAVISSVSLNHLGTPDPPPLVRLSLRGYLGYFEAVLDAARTAGTPRERLTRLLTDTLVAAIRAGQAAGD